MRYCGWDIGGAHLKFAAVDDDGRCLAVEQVPCALWMGVERLERALDELYRRFQLAGVAHAVTMTGELCDNFRDRSDGVAQIVDAFVALCGSRQCFIYTLNNDWLSPLDAAAHAEAVGSANWHATASFLATHFSDALVVDIGSTTTDIIPIVDHRVIATGIDDHTRLIARELVYSGVVRTPVMALVDTLTVGDQQVPIAAEHFATVADVYRLLGQLPATADQHPTADQQDKSTTASARRLLRMVGLDYLGQDDVAKQLAAEVAQKQYDIWSAGLRCVLSRDEFAGRAPLIIGIGPGQFVIERLAVDAGLDYRSFESLLSGDDKTGPTDMASWSTCAPAIAVAQILRQSAQVSCGN